MQVRLQGEREMGAGWETAGMSARCLSSASCRCVLRLVGVGADDRIQANAAVARRGRERGAAAQRAHALPMQMPGQEGPGRGRSSSYLDSVGSRFETLRFGADPVAP